MDEAVRRRLLAAGAKIIEPTTSEPVRPVAIPGLEEALHEVRHGPREWRGKLRISVPEDHTPDGRVTRWTAVADIIPGQPYTYSTIGFAVRLDWFGGELHPTDVTQDSNANDD